MENTVSLGRKREREALWPWPCTDGCLSAVHSIQWHPPHVPRADIVRTSRSMRELVKARGVMYAVRCKTVEIGPMRRDRYWHGRAFITSAEHAHAL